MNYCVSQINPKYTFNIVGASFIGKPRNNTAIFVTAKIKKLITNLSDVKECLVFVEKTIEIPPEYEESHLIIKCDDPQSEYASFALKIKELDRMNEPKYSFTSEGYYVGADVTMGNNVYIGPGCVIGHGVVIGDNAKIGAGSIINNAIIGNDFSCEPSTVIGVEAHFVAENEGKEFKIPSFGRVIIGNNVALGANVVVERGFNADTVINDYVMIDSLVTVGHDVIINSHVEITAGATIAGLVEIDEHAYIGMNSTIKQRLSIGKHSTVGMGAAIIAKVKDEQKYFGNPAKKFEF